jgi:flagellar basal body-associated protein FliL
MIQRNSKNKPLLFIILILLLANLAGIGYNYFMMKKDAPRHQPMDRKELMGRYLKDQLKFTNEQMVQYEKLSATNKAETEPLFEVLKQEKEKRMNFLRENNYSDSALDEAVDRSIKKQAMLDRKMLEHIRNIRSICNEAQKQHFDTSFYKMMRHNRGEKKSKKN